MLEVFASRMLGPEHAKELVSFALGLRDHFIKSRIAQQSSDLSTTSPHRHFLLLLQLPPSPFPT